MYTKIQIILLFALLLNVCTAQSYFTTGGVRLGSDYGLSLKQRILKKTTIEAILSSEGNINSNLGLSLLYDRHRSILTRNFNLFYGAGISWRWDYVNNESGYTKNTSFGIPLQGGIEFSIGRINLSWDYTPVLFLSNKTNAFTSSKGLSVRYVFVNKKEGKKFMKNVKTPFTKNKKRKK